jgi:hypothetical protein
VTAPKQTSALTFATETSPSEATIRAIESGLTAHATGLGLLTDWSPRWIIGRDQDEAVQAGIRFVLAFEWLFVNWLWVAQLYRKHGIGRAVAEPISTRSRFRRRSFTSGLGIGSSAGSTIFHPAMRAFGSRSRLADAMLAMRGGVSADRERMTRSFFSLREKVAAQSAAGGESRPEARARFVREPSP